MKQTNKKLVLGVTGGIAAYKAAELVRLLVKQHVDVQVVMTEAATQFITPMTMQALSGKPVFIGMWAKENTNIDVDNGMPHIELSREADAIVIAPASAEFMAKLLHGRADDLLSTLCLARDCPLLVAPAMNKQMWENPATQRNIVQLKADNITVLGPDSGEQACGEVGAGRMLEPEDLLAEINAFFTPKLLAGKRVLITAGATLEMIDPVRAITNLSSGKMGYAIAQAAANMGAAVTLVSGATALKPLKHVNNISATSAAAMYQAVMQHVGKQDIFISVAAVADYSPSKPNAQKIKKSDQENDGKLLTLELTKTKDILAEVASLPNAPFCVGFAAETEDLLQLAEEKRIRKKLPLLVANLVNESMGLDEANITLLDDNGTHAFAKATKEQLAVKLVTHICDMLNTKKQTK